MESFPGKCGDLDRQYGGTRVGRPVAVCSYTGREPVKTRGLSHWKVIFCAGNGAGGTRCCVCLQQMSIGESLSTGTEPCEDQNLKAEPLGCWISIADGPPSVLDQAHCLPKVVNYAFPILVDSFRLIMHQVLYSHPQDYLSQECVHPPTLGGVCTETECTLGHFWLVIAESYSETFYANLINAVYTSLVYLGLTLV